MPAQLDCHRLLLASGDRNRLTLRTLLSTPRFAAWEVLEADTVEQARFVLQMDPCDVLLLDAGLYRNSDPETVTWLAVQQRAPVLLLADYEAHIVASALQNGARQWLPRDVALRHPDVLAATLRRVAEVGELQRQARVAGETLHDCRKQVSRLVSLLWEATPGGSSRSWFPQRQLLERLEEEVARSKRHGDALTVILGEVQPEGSDRLPPEESQQLATWTATQVTKSKRRCDVAGQYGLNGFLLVLPHTTEQGAVHCCQRIRIRLEQPEATTTASLSPLHACFGMASISTEVSTIKGLLSRAEESLERAKAKPERLEF